MGFFFFIKLLALAIKQTWINKVNELVKSKPAQTNYSLLNLVRLTLTKVIKISSYYLLA